MQEYIDYANEYFTEYAQSLNVSFETYRKENLGFETQEEYDNYIKEEALANLKTKFIIEAIAEEENITISQEEIEEEINNYITYNGFENKEAVLEFVTEDEIVVNLKYYKVMDLIYSESVLITTNNQGINVKATLVAFLLGFSIITSIFVMKNFLEEMKCVKK